MGGRERENATASEIVSIVSSFHLLLKSASVVPAFQSRSQALRNILGRRHAGIGSFLYSEEQLSWTWPEVKKRRRLLPPE